MYKKYIIGAIVLSCIATSCSSNDNPIVPGVQWETTSTLDLPSEQSIVVKNYSDFGLNFFNAFANSDVLLKDSKENFAISPLSATEAVTILANITSGQSREMIINALGFDSLDDLNEVNGKLMRYLPHNFEGTTMSLVNGLWYDKQYTLNPEFVGRLSDYCMSPVVAADLRDLKTVSLINDWSKRNTNGLIPNIVSQDIIKKDIPLILANALYYRGSWLNEFDKAKTTKDYFTTSKNEVVTTEFMNRSDLVLYAASDNFKIISLPYKDNHRCMDIVLPAEGTDIYAFAANFDSEKYRSSLIRLKDTTVKLSLPKYKINVNFQLTNILEQLGLSTSGMDFNPFGIHNYYNQISMAQFCSIAVDEKGAEMAAVTTVLPDGSLKPFQIPEFKANRPFLFFVRDAETDILLMAGGVLNPTEL